MPPTLTNARPRVDILASWRYGAFADSPLAPGDDSTTPAPDASSEPVDAPNDDSAENAVDDAVKALRAAWQAAQEAQAGDTDDDPNDVKVEAALVQIGDLLDTLEAAQAADDSDDTSPPLPSDATSARARIALATDDTTPAPKTGTAPMPDAEPNASPVDADGNVDAKTVCANPDCGHLAAEHGNLPAGENSGECSQCSCSAMAVNTSTIADDGSNGGGPDNADGGDQPQGAGATSSRSRGSMAAVAPDAGTDAPDAAAPVPTADAPNAATAGTEPNVPPPVASSASMGPAFSIPVGVIEGQPTGDGRSIALEALDWRLPPMPLMGLATETHDPSGMDSNAPSVICGRIDSLSRAAGDDGTQVVSANGFFLDDANGAYFAGLAEQMGRIGVSADIAVEEQQVSITETDDDGWPTSMDQQLTKGTIMGFTVCPFPAFEGCYLVLGDGAEGGPPAVATPQASEPEAPVVASARPTFFAYEDCGCGPDADVIIASAGPDRPPRAWFDEPAFGFGSDDSHVANGDPRLSKMTNGAYACPVTITDDGELFGHIGAWGVCHMAVTGECVMLPHSPSNYAHFKRGQHLITAEGEAVRVGVLTAGIGHASKRFGATATMAHYDDTRLACADVNVGEDAYGIWIHGRVRPDATEAQRQALRAAAPSGDWRNPDGLGLDLVAVLQVNEPGFPLALVADGKPLSLTAAGSQVMYRLAHPKPKPVEPGDVALRHAMAPLLAEAGSRVRERIGV